MKSILLLFALIFYLSSLDTKAQNEKTLLYPPKGETSIYEMTESKYLVDKKGEKLSEFVQTKIIQVERKTVSDRNKNVLVVKVLENKAEKPDEKLCQLRDYQYPVFRDGFYDNHNNNFYEQLFFQVTFLYDFDEKNSEIKLNNREEILLKIRSILEEKGFNKEGIDRNTEDFNTKAIPLNKIYSVFI